MFKRGIGHYVVLALCVLGLVLQPLIVFSADYSPSVQAYEASNFDDLISFYASLSANYTPSGFAGDSVAMALLSHFNLSPNDYYIIYSQSIYYAIPFSCFITRNPRSGGGGSANTGFSVRNYSGESVSLFNYNVSSGDYSSSSLAHTNSQSYYNTSSSASPVIWQFALYNYGGYTLYFNKSSASVSLTNPQYSVTLSEQNQGDNQFPDISDLSPFSGYPAEIYAYLTQESYHAAARIINDEFPGRVPSGGDSDKFYYQDYDSGMFAQSILINTMILETYLHHNESYFANLSNNLALFANNQNRIQAYVSGLIPSVDGIEDQLLNLNSSVDAFINKFDAAFPSAEADINDAIANSVLDDSSDSGLTVSKISGAKSNLDDSLSKFSVNIGSAAEFSGVGSALDGQDWSFWSQQTFDNCYMFTFDPFEAQLMDDEDVATQEDNLFKHLLGWD